MGRIYRFLCELNPIEIFVLFEAVAISFLAIAIGVSHALNYWLR